MHDLRVGFQNSQNVCIYRGPGKCKLPLVFYSIPYGLGSEIGGLDGDSESEIPVLGAKMSLFMTTPENHEKRHFSDILSENYAF